MMTQDELNELAKMARECKDKILPAIESVTEFVVKVTRRLENRYAWVIMNMAPSENPVEYSRENIRTIISIEFGEKAVMNHLSEIQMIHDFCRRYKRFSVELAKMPEDVVAKNLIQAPFAILNLPSIHRRLTTNIRSLIESANQSFVTLYKFPYVFANYNKFASVIGNDPNVNVSSLPSIESQLIVLQILLLRFSRSKDISWIIGRGLRDSVVFADEDIDQIVELLPR